MAQNPFSAIRQAYESGDIEKTRALIHDALVQNPIPQLYRLAAEVAINQEQRNYYLEQAAQLEAPPEGDSTQPTLPSTQPTLPSIQPDSICPYCGTPNAPGNTVCTRCGFSLAGENLSASPPPPSKSRVIKTSWIVAAVILLCVSLWVVVLVFTGRRILTRDQRALSQPGQTATAQALLLTILAELPSPTPGSSTDSPVATSPPAAETATPIQTAAPPPDAPDLEPGRVTTEDYNFYNPAIAPDHHALAAAIQVGDNWQIVEIDPLSGLIQKRLTDPDQIYTNPLYSDDGQTLLLRGIINGNSNLYLADAQTGNILQKLTNVPESIAYPRWMPDYQSFLYKRYSDADSEIFIGYLDGSAPTQLTDNNRYDGSPAPSPDGRLIAMSSFIDGNYEIVVLDRDTGGFQQLTFDPGRDSEPVFSPDGGWIAFESDRGGDYNIWAVRPDGSDLKRLTFDSKNELIPAFSPGGGWLYFQQRQPNGNFSINRVPWP